MKQSSSQPQPPIKTFKTQKAFETWLSTNHHRQEGIFLQIYKKASGITSIDYAQALDAALCYGWIDGMRKSHDEVSFLQRFTPRRAKSIWSKKNVEHVARLIDTDKMQPPGLAEIERAKADGRWENAYEAQSTMQVPEDFLKEVSKDKKALAFYESLNKQNKFAIAFRLQQAQKPETRQKRMNEFLAMMKEGKKFH